MSERILRQQLYGIDDFVIVPDVVTDIESRTKMCDARYEANDDVEYKHYGLFTAPMTPVVGPNNYEAYIDNGVIPIIPRTTPLRDRLNLMFDTFVAMGKDEFRNELIDKIIDVPDGKKIRVCLDVANGHMRSVLQISKKAKKIYGDDIVIMAGNIANPKSYYMYASAGISYIRCGIGSGNVCTTAANTGVHYPLGSLILGCAEQREMLIHEMDHTVQKDREEIYKGFTIPKIIADGGFKNFDQINKAYALGADYVMLGELFARTSGGCGKVRISYKHSGSVPPGIAPYNCVEKDSSEINEKDMVQYLEAYNVEREYYGMSTKKAQIEMGKDPNTLRTSEGIVKFVKVEYTLKGWLENMEHYLKSAMSYCNCKSLAEFIGTPIMGINSSMARAAFYK